jgi:hypothetical protein
LLLSFDTGVDADSHSFAPDGMFSGESPARYNRRANARGQFMLKANDLHKVTHLNRLSTYFQSTGVRWALTLTWTVIAASLLLSPSGDGTTVSWISTVFGGTETTDAIGHVFINIILSVLWCWTTNLYTSVPRTTHLILFGGIVWCFGAELSQVFVPERGTSLLDLAANILGVSIGLLVYRWLAAIVFQHLYPG